MDHVRQQLWRIPDRFSPVLARWLIVLSLAIIGIAGLGLVLYDGWHRVAYFSAFLLIGVGNLAWAFGSLLPDDRLAATLRGIVRLTTIPMFVALTVALGFQTGILP